MGTAGHPLPTLLWPPLPSIILACISPSFEVVSIVVSNTRVKHLGLHIKMALVQVIAPVSTMPTQQDLLHSPVDSCCNSDDRRIILGYCTRRKLRLINFSARYTQHVYFACGCSINSVLFNVPVTMYALS